MEIVARGERISLEVPFEQPHLRRNLLAAVAAGQAVGVRPSGRLDYVPGAGRGQRIRVPGGITVVDDCYNANPMSMRAALEDLARRGPGDGRRVAVLGDMLELGPQERQFHREVGALAARAEVDLLITVGPLAAAMADGFGPGRIYAAADAAEAAGLVQELLEPGDTVLVKGSNGVGLKLVVDSLCTGAPV
jgi:UDP-N-acetylmuramoyl-tripeptide--D-alanyl-D-alanine ligase